MKIIILVLILLTFANSCIKENEYEMTPNATFEIVTVGNGKIELHSHDANAIVQISWGDTIETFNFRNQTKVEHQYKSNGTFTVTVNNEVRHGDDYYWEKYWSKEIQISDILYVDFEYRFTDAGVLKCLFIGVAATTFGWNFGDNSPIVNGASSQHEYSSNGRYKVTLTASNENYSDSISKWITVIK